MPGPVSQSYNGPQDGVPPFPPRWAMEHLTDTEYEAMKSDYHEKHKAKGVRRRDDVTLADLTGLLTEHLPTDWVFTLRMRANEIDMYLFDPQGKTVDRDHDDRMSFDERVMDFLNYARQSDGLSCVDMKGLCCRDIQILDSEYDKMMEED